MAAANLGFGSQESQINYQLATQAPSAYSFTPPQRPALPGLKRSHDLVDDSRENAANPRKLTKLSEPEVPVPSRAEHTIQRKNEALFNLVSPSVLSSKFCIPHAPVANSAAPQDNPKLSERPSIGIRIGTQPSPSGAELLPPSSREHCHRHAGLHFMQSLLDEGNDSEPADAVASVQADLDQNAADVRALCAKAQYEEVAAKIKELPVSQTQAVLSSLQPRHLSALLSHLRPKRRALRIRAPTNDGNSSPPALGTDATSGPPASGNIPHIDENEDEDAESDSDAEEALPPSQRERSASPIPEWSSSPARPSPVRHAVEDARPPDSSYHKAPLNLPSIEFEEQPNPNEDSVPIHREGSQGREARPEEPPDKEPRNEELQNEELQDEQPHGEEPQNEELLDSEDDSSDSDIEESVPHAYGEDHFTSSPPVAESHSGHHYEDSMTTQHETPLTSQGQQSPQLPLNSSSAPSSPENQPPSPAMLIPGTWHGDEHQQPSLDAHSTPQEQASSSKMPPSVSTSNPSQTTQPSTTSQDWRPNTQNEIPESPDTLYHDRRRSFFQQQPQDVPQPTIPTATPDQEHEPSAQPQPQQPHADNRTRTDIYTAFQQAYPTFHSTEIDFSHLCQQLRQHGAGIEPRFYDDFVLVVTQHRRLHILGASSDPFAHYERFVKDPQAQRGILDAATLRIAALPHAASVASASPTQTIPAPPWSSSTSSSTPRRMLPWSTAPSSAKNTPRMPRPAAPSTPVTLEAPRHQTHPQPQPALQPTHSRDATLSTLSNAPPPPASSTSSVAMITAAAASSAGKNESGAGDEDERNAAPATPLQAWARDYRQLRWHDGLRGGRKLAANVLAWGF